MSPRENSLPGAKSHSRQAENYRRIQEPRPVNSGSSPHCFPPLFAPDLFEPGLVFVSHQEENDGGNTHAEDGQDNAGRGRSVVEITAGESLVLDVHEVGQTGIVAAGAELVPFLAQVKRVGGTRSFRDGILPPGNLFSRGKI